MLKLICSIPLSCILLVSLGCGEPGNPGVVPASTDPKATRAFIENPSGVQPKQSAASKKNSDAASQPLK